MIVLTARSGVLGAVWLHAPHSVARAPRVGRSAVPLEGDVLQVIVAVEAIFSHQIALKSEEEDLTIV